jgi:GNAT superfamily N-acetyltransferase
MHVPAIRPAITEPSIRYAEARDFADVRRHWNAVHDLHAAHMPDTFNPLRATDMPPEHFGVYLNDRHLLLIAELDGAIAGSLLASLQVTEGVPGYMPGYTINIWHVFTEQEARRRGVASALLAATAEWAQSQGAVRICLTVWSFNAEALALYSKLGFGAAYTGLMTSPSHAVERLGQGRLPRRPPVLQPVSRWSLPKWLRR